MDMRNSRGAFSLMGILLALMALTAIAQDLLPVPALTARVIDKTGTLSVDQQSKLEARLAAFEAERGAQIVVLLVPTTRPEDIAAYANRVANTWKIGRREVGDGVLLVVAKNDHTVRIEVARALEGAVPDLAGRQIIDQRIVPAFRAGDFHAGIDHGLDGLTARIRGEVLPLPTRPGGAPHDNDPSEHVGALAAFALIVAVWSTVVAWAGARAGETFSLPLVVAMSVLVALLPIGWLVAFFESLVGMAMVLIAAYTTTALLLLRRYGLPRLASRWASLGSSSNEHAPIRLDSTGPGTATSGPDEGVSSSDAGGFSSGGGGSFGGGGASGRW